MNHPARLQYFLAFILFFLILGGTRDSGATRIEDVPRISVHDLKKMLGNPDLIILDVRKMRSWWRSDTKILGAIREDASKVINWIDKYPKDKILVFYCT